VDYTQAICFVFVLFFPWGHFPALRTGAAVPKLSRANKIHHQGVGSPMATLVGETTLRAAAQTPDLQGNPRDSSERAGKGEFHRAHYTSDGSSFIDRHGAFIPDTRLVPANLVILQKICFFDWWTSNARI
jgi:hypothetical protein